MARKLTEKQRVAQRKAVAVIKARKIIKVEEIKKSAMADVNSLSDKERWLMGICLYWAEGSKEKDSGVRVQFSNSDPDMIIFFREWIFDFLHVDPMDLIYTLYIHKNSPNIAFAIDYWSKRLSIEPHSISLFYKKENSHPKRKNIGVKYRGLVRLVVRRSIDMNRRISGWIGGIIAASHVSQ